MPPKKMPPPPVVTRAQRDYVLAHRKLPVEQLVADTGLLAAQVEAILAEPEPVVSRFVEKEGSVAMTAAQSQRDDGQHEKGRDHVARYSERASHIHTIDPTKPIR